MKKGIACFLKYLMKPLILIVMLYIWIGKQAVRLYQMLPLNLLQAICGLALCFFGGRYFAAIAAIEAFRNFGGEMCWEELRIVWEQGSLSMEASEQDDWTDANADGIPDVQQMSTNELISHKAKVVMAAVQDPDRLMKAITYLLTAYVSVLATLKLQFARTVAISLGIASMLEKPAVRMMAPLLGSIMGRDLQHWAAPVISTSSKVVAVTVASYMQAVISAFYAALRGGSMIGSAVIRGLSRLSDSAKPFNPEESYLDEAIGFPIAALGFLFQLKYSFALPYPWVLLEVPLFPLTLLETLLRWEIFT